MVNGVHVAMFDIAKPKFAPRRGSKNREAACLEHIGNHPNGRASQTSGSADYQSVSTDTLNRSAHRNQKTAQLNYMWFLRCQFQYCTAGCCCSCQNNVLRTCYRGFGK